MTIAPPGEWLQTANKAPSRSSYARDGDIVSGTVHTYHSRPGVMLLSLHDMSGRDLEVDRADLKRVVDNPRCGDRFAFRLHIDSTSGKLTASRIQWLAPGQTIDDR
jgi:hypothetical protein